MGVSDSDLEVSMTLTIAQVKSAKVGSETTSFLIREDFTCW